MARSAVLRWDNVKTAPVWLKDFLELDMISHYPAIIDPSQFTDQGGILVTTSAIAAIGATSVAVTALPDAIPAGTFLYFGAAGSGKIAYVTAAAAKGATALTVEALVVALASGDTAILSRYGRKFLPSGTLLGRTYTERDAGTGFGPAATSDDEFGLLLFDKEDLVRYPDIELLRPNAGVTVAENFLPGWSGLSSGLKAVVRARWNTITGAD